MSTFISYDAIAKTVAECLLDCLEAESTREEKMTFLQEVLIGCVDPQSLQMLFLMVVLANIQEHE
jgi:hypothetical protein